MKKVDVPKQSKRKVDALSKREVSIFIKELEKLPIMQQTIYTLLLTTGIRRGECFGLWWDDIDFANKCITIKRSVTYTSLYGVQVGLPKTDMGLRTIPLTDQMSSLLFEHKKEQQKNCNIAKDMFVFPSPESPYKPHQPCYITKHLKNL